MLDMTGGPGLEVERIISIFRQNETGLPSPKTQEAERQDAGNLTKPVRFIVRKVVHWSEGDVPLTTNLALQILVALKQPRANPVGDERTEFLWQSSLWRYASNASGPQWCESPADRMAAGGQSGCRYETSKKQTEV
jgi:hypothetical protein